MDLDRDLAGDQAAAVTIERETFGDRLSSLVAERSSQIVLGLDPDPSHVWPQALEAASGTGHDPAQRAAIAVRAHCELVIDAAGDQCVAVKPQVACFERLGAPGWEWTR